LHGGIGLIIGEGVRCGLHSRDGRRKAADLGVQDSVHGLNTWGGGTGFATVAVAESAFFGSRQFAEPLASDVPDRWRTFWSSS
jgi:hypothetical protein